MFYRLLVKAVLPPARPALVGTTILGRPSYFLNGKKRKQALNSVCSIAQLGGLGDTATTEASNYKTTF
jgi:hypothetical protein